MSTVPLQVGVTYTRIASLDGLRALSIVMVLIGHLEGTRRFPALQLGRWVGDLAHLGVIVFFIISGFLITTLLINEQQQSGKISLFNFYLRRALRIFPAFYTFIAMMIVAKLCGWITLNTNDIFYSLTYTMNYHAQRSWVVGHLWSLSVEEQFYMLWPIIFMLLSRRTALIVTAAGVLFGPLTRLAMHLIFSTHSPWRDLEIFPAMVDNLAIGCAAALLRPWLLSKKWYLKLSSSYWLIFLIPLILLINRMLNYTVIDTFGSPVMLVGLTLLIEASTRHAHSMVGRLLNWSPITFVGLISYSLYLWQQPFLNRHSLATLNAFPQNIIMAILAALISYFFVEKSFLNLRRRFEKSKFFSDRQLLQPVKNS